MTKCECPGGIRGGGQCCPRCGGSQQHKAVQSPSVAEIERHEQDGEFDAGYYEDLEAEGA